MELGKTPWERGPLPPSGVTILPMQTRWTLNNISTAHMVVLLPRKNSVPKETNTRRPTSTGRTMAE